MLRPTGTVTFFFTDIEGSTRRWEADASTMRRVITRHDAILTAGIEGNRGVALTERGEGDSFFAVFVSAPDAVAAALDIQRALKAEPWPDATPVLVRVAIHTGQAGDDYRGPDTNRAARIRAIGHGGQVLLSHTSQALVSLALMGVTALASFVVVTIDSSSSSWPSWEVTLKAFGALVLQLAVWTSLGAFVGIAFRSAAAAIGGGLVYLFVVEALLGSLFRTTPVVKEILKFLPGVNADAINATFPVTIGESGATTQVVGAGRGVVTLLLYLAIFTIGSLLIFRERDVGGS